MTEERPESPVQRVAVRHREFCVEEVRKRDGEIGLQSSSQPVHVVCRSVSVEAQRRKRNERRTIEESDDERISDDFDREEGDEPESSDLVRLGESCSASQNQRPLPWFEFQGVNKLTIRVLDGRVEQNLDREIGLQNRCSTETDQVANSTFDRVGHSDSRSESCNERLRQRASRGYEQRHCELTTGKLDFDASRIGDADDSFRKVTEEAFPHSSRLLDDRSFRDRLGLERVCKRTGNQLKILPKDATRTSESARSLRSLCISSRELDKVDHPAVDEPADLLKRFVRLQTSLFHVCARSSARARQSDVRLTISRVELDGEDVRSGTDGADFLDESLQKKESLFGCSAVGVVPSVRVLRVESQSSHMTSRTKGTYGGEELRDEESVSSVLEHGVSV